MKRTPPGWYAFQTCSRPGASFLQGPHHEAHTFNTTIRPVVGLRDTVPGPVSERTLNAGAGRWSTTGCATESTVARSRAPPLPAREWAHTARPAESATMSGSTKTATRTSRSGQGARRGGGLPCEDACSLISLGLRGHLLTSGGATWCG